MQEISNQTDQHIFVLRVCARGGRGGGNWWRSTAKYGISCVLEIQFTKSNDSRHSAARIHCRTFCHHQRHTPTPTHRRHHMQMRPLVCYTWITRKRRYTGAVVEGLGAQILTMLLRPNQWHRYVIGRSHAKHTVTHRDDEFLFAVIFWPL